MARPELYDEAIALEIANRVSEGGSLFKIGEDPEMPTARTMLAWCQKHPQFDRLLTHARLNKGDFYFDQSMQIADEEVTTAAEAARQRTRVQSRQWAAARLNPRRYAEKLALGQASDLDPLEHRPTEIESARRVAFLFKLAMRALQGETAKVADN